MKGRAITLVLFVAFGLVFLSRSCALPRATGPIALTHGRIVSATGAEQATRFVSIADGKITAVSFSSDRAPAAFGAREFDVNGLYIAATTFDRSAPKLIDGIRHVWVGQIGPGYPGDVVIMRSSPGRIRAGYVPETDSIVGAVVDGVYYNARDLNRRK
jgi:imidazolonepropionase-like amidohydrolase